LYTCTEQSIQLKKIKEKGLTNYFNRINSIIRFYLETPLLVPSMHCARLVMEGKYWN